MAEDSAAAVCDQMQCGGVDPAMGQPYRVAFAQDEGFNVFGCEGLQDCGVADAALKIFINSECELGEQFGLSEQEDAIVSGAFFEQQPEFSQVCRMHEVGIVDGLVG